MLQNKKICILSHFGSFQDSYALHIGWLERAKILEYYNIDFDFLVNDKCNTDVYPHQRNVLKNVSKMSTFKKRVEFFEREYIELLSDYDIILTCDLVYQRGGNFLPQNQAMRNVSKHLKAHWFHWIHSAWTNPNPNEKYPDSLRNQMPPRSTLVYMNESEKDGIAKMYNTSINNVKCVWNPKDIRSFKDFHPLAWEVTKKLDIPNKDIVQIFPHCATRMNAKGIDSIIKIFASLKDKGQKVALVLANGNASRVQGDIKKKKKYMEDLGLVSGEDFLFTHEITQLRPFPRKAVADIFSISNLFIFASYREVSPNVLLEAKISDNLLVLNKRLKCVQEFGGENAIYFESSFKTPGIRDGEPGDMQVVKYNNEKKYFYNLANAIIKTVKNKKHIWKFSYENIWKNQLYPLLNSAKTYEVEEYKKEIKSSPIDISIYDDKKWNGVRKEIRWFIDYLKPIRYLEIGLGDGRNFNNAPIKEKVCISPKGCVKNPDRMYHGNSDDIFESLGEDPFDLIFIDGFHNYKQVVKDLNNSLEYLKPNGVILIHDVNPLDKPDFVSGDKQKGGKPWCGDVWKIIPHIKYKRTDLDFVNIEEFPGLTVVWKRKNKRKIIIKDEKMFSDYRYPCVHLTIDYARKHKKLFDFLPFEDAIKKFIDKRNNSIENAGLISIYNFPMADKLIIDLAKRVDYLSIRLDPNGDKLLFKSCIEKVKKECELNIIESKLIWNRWNWREELIRSLDNIKPKNVLFLDEDETYSDEFNEDFENFQRTNLKYMAFDYEMITENSTKVDKYPKARHCKVFKWMEGITYQPYKGYAIPTFPINPQPDYHIGGYRCKSKIKHYCFYTDILRKNKKLHK